MNTSICTTCDHQIDSTDSFCRHCGALVPRTGITAPLDRRLLVRHFLKRRSFLQARFVLPAGLAIGCLLGTCIGPKQSTSPISTTTQFPVVAEAVSEVAPEYIEYKKRVALSFSVYYDRRAWEDHIHGQVFVEDFESDQAGRSELKFPYSTGKQFVLEGQSVATIANTTTALPTRNQLRLVDWQVGSTLRFPHATPVTAFGFDYQSAGDWTPINRNVSTLLHKSEKGFIGFVFDQGTSIDQFRLASNADNSVLSVDNISFVTEVVPPITK